MTPAFSFVGFARFFVALCWLGFFLPFVHRKKRTREAMQRRAPAARAGILIQAASFAVAWALGADRFPSAALPGPALFAFCGLGMLLAVGSVWLVVVAVRVLGKQWSVEARLVEGHRLVVEGPYSHMRHPIYTGMLGMLLATGLTFTAWWGLPVAVGIYAVGTAIRVRAEERLLQEAFGEDFEAYRRYVPAIIPRWKI